MEVPIGYKSIAGSEHFRPTTQKDLGPTNTAEEIMVTVMLRRSLAGTKTHAVGDFTATSSFRRVLISRSEFASSHGANGQELAAVQSFASQNGLDVVDSNQARRSVYLRGSVANMNKAFEVQMHDYEWWWPREHSHAGPANVPLAIADYVTAVVGLTNKKIAAVHHTVAMHPHPSDPPGTAALTPQTVASLYNFPTGTGSGQTIGIYEMETGSGPAGYTVSDLQQSINAFGGGLNVPRPVDVSVDGVTNSGSSDGETGLDITVAGAIAQGAEIAVYFTGGDPQNIIHALQEMIHPSPGNPEPTVISISYGWGPDDPKVKDGFTPQEFEQMDQLFQDAATLNITVLVSAGDNGAFIESKAHAQSSYPATEPWVIACGGTTIGNAGNTAFDEWVWNDGGATGGGVSNRFPVPAYQTSARVPNNIVTHKPGRGIPDIAGNASENSGYVQFINGSRTVVGGTSAVAPLYAGLIAIINSNLGFSAGFINPILYSAPASTFRDIVGAPGPANNSFNHVTGYPAGTGWDACTGLGAVNGVNLQNALSAASPAVR